MGSRNSQLYTRGMGEREKSFKRSHCKKGWRRDLESSSGHQHSCSTADLLVVPKVVLEDMLEACGVRDAHEASNKAHFELKGGFEVNRCTSELQRKTAKKLES